MNPIIRFLNRITIYAVITYGIIFCIGQPIRAQTPGGRPLKYYGVDRGNPITDSNYSTLASHEVKTVVVDTDVNGSASSWQNMVNLAAKYNFNIVIWPSDWDDHVANCGWESPYHANGSGDFIWEVKPLLDAIGGNSRVIGIVNAHEAPWTCITSIKDMAATKTQLKEYVKNKFGREDFKTWNYIGNLGDLSNISDYTGPADIGKIMDVAALWLHCIGGAEGTCEQAEQRILSNRTTIKNAGLEGKVDLLFLFQTFSMGGGYKMATLADMQAWDCRFINTGALDGFMWYTWGADWYSSDLDDHPELWPEMNRVYNECVNNSSPSPTPPPSGKPGDANSDGRVDGLDYVVWLNHFNQTTSAGPSAGDFNRSGKVDGLDYIIWLNNFGQ